MRDELAVGGEEIVTREFTGEDPRGLLKGTGADIRFVELGREEVDFEFFGSGGVVVADAGNFHGFCKGNAEFFAQLAREGLLEGFARTNFSSGEFPFEGRGVVASALADEESPISTFNYSCYDLDH